MTSPVPSAFTNQELHGLQRERGAGSQSITWEQSAPGSQRLCTSPLRVPAPAAACVVAQGSPGHRQMPRNLFGTVQNWQEQAAFNRGLFSAPGLWWVLFPAQTRSESLCCLQRRPPSAHPIPPQNRLKCQHLQLGPRPGWVPAQGRGAAGRLWERGEGCPPRPGPSVPNPRRGGGQVMSGATPEHLQGCLRETSNSATEAPAQESSPPPSLPTLLLGLICTDLPRRLRADLPCPWQGFDRGGGAGARRGADRGELPRGGWWGPTGAWLAKSSSDLEKALMCTDGAGWKQNQLGWKRTCSARGWFGAGCVRGSGLAPCSSPLPPEGRQRKEGKVTCKIPLPTSTFLIDE